MKLSLVLLAVAVALCGAEVARYDNYRVYRVTPRADRNIMSLQLLQETNDYDFWSDISLVGRPVDIMVAPHLFSRFAEFMRDHNLEHFVMIENVQETINGVNPKAHLGAMRNRAIDWNAYYPLEEIYYWLNELQETYPGVVTVVKGGETFEGRDILGVHVTFKPENADRIIFIEAGIHAREWISPATTTYILNQLLTSEDAAVRAMAESFDWYIFPSYNPDGYVYTWETERLWRKTRTPYGLCYGADPNRNWASHWNEGGASNNACSDTYAGPSAFSEIETKSMSEFVNTLGDRIWGYIAFHSYSQLLLLPYGHSDEHVENYDELYEIGLLGAASLAERYGTEYTVGNIVEVLYVASGGSMDWVKATYGTRVTYTYELRDTGRYGFLLPADQIIPTAEETLDSLLTIVQEFQNRR